MKRNILLTTLGNTFDHSRHAYFSYEKNGRKEYCEGISTAEAGAKYILSKQPVDKIIVLGPPSAYRDENIDQELKLRDFCNFGADLPERYSEYKFFCYRIMQFLNHIDIEGNDLLEQASEQEREELLLKAARCTQSAELSEGRKFREIFADTFARLDEDQAQYQQLISHLSLDKKKEKWFRHYLFMVLKRAYKFRALGANEDITVQFVPTVPKGENNLRMGNLTGILDSIMGGSESEVNVFVDLQGMDIADSHTLLNVLFMLQNEKSRSIQIQEIITTTYRPALFTNPIEDQKKRLELSELLSGMDAFLQYGKVDSIRRYWMSRNIANEHIDRLLYAMQTIDVGITLSNVSDMERGIQMLKLVFADPQKPSSDIVSMIFHILETGILHDYGPLLKGEEIDILALIKWAMKKHFYQQTLTIIESRVPHDLVRRGVFYYARNEEDKIDFMNRINEIYWNTPLKDRYQFDDLDHYFIKFYRRREVYLKRPENPIVTFVSTRVGEAYGEDDKVRSFTQYHGKRELLEEFILAYLQIGNIRNQISHAQEAHIDAQDWDINAQNERIQILESSIMDFVKLYEKIKSGINKKQNDSIVIPEEEFKSYAKSHPIYRNKKKEKEQKKDSSS